MLATLTTGKAANAMRALAVLGTVAAAATPAMADGPAHLPVERYTHAEFASDYHTDETLAEAQLSVARIRAEVVEARQHSGTDSIAVVNQAPERPVKPQGENFTLPSPKGYVLSVGENGGHDFTSWNCQPTERTWSCDFDNYTLHPDGHESFKSSDRFGTLWVDQFPDRVDVRASYLE